MAVSCQTAPSVPAGHERAATRGSTARGGAGRARPWRGRPRSRPLLPGKLGGHPPRPKAGMGERASRCGSGAARSSCRPRSRAWRSRCWSARTGARARPPPAPTGCCRAGSTEPISPPSGCERTASARDSSDARRPPRRANGARGVAAGADPRGAARPVPAPRRQMGAGRSSPTTRRRPRARLGAEARVRRKGFKFVGA